MLFSAYLIFYIYSLTQREQHTYALLIVCTYIHAIIRIYEYKAIRVFAFKNLQYFQRIISTFLLNLKKLFLKCELLKKKFALVFDFVFSI